MMTIKEAILQALDDLKKPLNRTELYEYINENNLVVFNAKNPKASVNSEAGNFIRKNDSRVKRIKGKNNIFYYYLSKYEDIIEFENNKIIKTKTTKQELKLKQSYNEKDLHKLLSSYLKNKNIYSKTILHEESKIPKMTIKNGYIPI